MTRTGCGELLRASVKRWRPAQWARVQRAHQLSYTCLLTWIHGLSIRLALPTNFDPNVSLHELYDVTPGRPGLGYWDSRVGSGIDELGWFGTRLERTRSHRLPVIVCEIVVQYPGCFVLMRSSLVVGATRLLHHTCITNRQVKAHMPERRRVISWSPRIGRGLLCRCCRGPES